MEIPDRLYKYQPYSSYALESLINKKIWISDPTRFNDPFDCKVRIPDELEVADINSILDAHKRRVEAIRDPEGQQLFRALVPRLSMNFGDDLDPEEQAMQAESFAIWKQMIGMATGSIGVYSMTGKRDDLLMWAHYADHHRGFVIGFDCTQLENTEEMQVFPVGYTDAYPKLTKSELTDTATMAEFLRLLSSSKGQQWQDEEEWRLVFPFKDQLVSMSMQPVEIIFGHRMLKAHRSTLYKLVSNTYDDVAFSTLEPSLSRYALEPHSYEPE